MRKFFSILTLAFASLFIYSCDNRNDDVKYVDNTNYIEVGDSSVTFNSSNNFTLSVGLNIPKTSIVLVYRNIGFDSNNDTIWQLIPKTYYLDDNTSYSTNRRLDYNFDFTTQEVKIKTQANFNQSTQMTNPEKATYLNNQSFRIVLVPASKLNKGATNSPVDYNDYNAVIKYYNIDDSKVVKIN